MDKDKRSRVLSIIAFIAGVLLLLSPISGIADRPDLTGGLPFSLLFVFLAWLFVILVIFAARTKPASKK